MYILIQTNKYTADGNELSGSYQFQSFGGNSSSGGYLPAASLRGEAGGNNKPDDTSTININEENFGTDLTTSSASSYSDSFSSQDSFISTRTTITASSSKCKMSATINHQPNGKPAKVATTTTSTTTKNLTSLRASLSPKMIVSYYELF